MTTDTQKIATMDKILEMNANAREFWIMRPNRYNEDVEHPIRVEVKLRSPDGDTLEITVNDLPLVEAVDEAYGRFRTFLDKMPAFDSSRALAYTPE